jgi:cation diffusion facilitator CzcD-associated flavoprotein CzcO
MAYPDLPFPQDLPSFITNAEVQKYLETYTEHFNFKKYIKFNHQVLSIKPGNKDKEWDVIVKDLTNETTHKIVFDAIVVCNG